MSAEDQLEFNLGDEETETDVSIEQSEDGSKTTAKVVKNEPEMNVEQEDAPSSHREELESVSEGVQKRISKLTARMREAERREQAAVDYAKGLQSQTTTLQQKLVNTDYSRLNETKSRLEIQQQTLKEIIKRAREEGDIDTETEAHQRLTDMVMEQRQVAGYLQQQSAEIERYKQQPVQQQQVQQAPQKPAPSPRAERWAGDNPWFGQDRVLTYAAWGLHQTLVEQEGVDPNTEEYYTQLDQRLRDEFPKRFAPQQTRQQRSVPAVAPASRSSGVNSARRTVRLSPSQVAIAKKLGVPLEEYAKYVKE
tara:strand:+ start:5271 stop:6194 length:924 start_codon:yes stop_codon:yes gene_type:complete